MGLLDMSCQWQISFKALIADPALALEFVWPFHCRLGAVLLANMFQERLLRHSHKQLSFSTAEQAPEYLEMGLGLRDPHHVVDVHLVCWVDSILFCNMLGGVGKPSEASCSSLSLVAHVTVEELVSVDLQMSVYKKAPPPPI